MGKSLFVPLMVILSLSLSPALSANAASQASQKNSQHERKLAIDEKSTTKHSTKVNGKKIKYTAKRPLVISFNGGPDSASVWMHVAYTGPRVLNVNNEGYPLQPYGVKTNEVRL